MSYTNIYLLKSLDHCPVQHVAKKINCLDSVKTCIVFVWQKIFLLSWKTFCFFNCDVPSTIERCKKKKRVKALLIIWCSLLQRDKKAKQRENKWVFNLIWESENVVTSLLDCEGNSLLKVITSWINSHPVKSV